MAADPIFTIPPIKIHQRFAALGRERRTWAIDKRQQGAIRNLGPHRGKGIRVGLVDTGVDRGHASAGDLRGKIKAARDFSRSHLTGTQDGMGHGTHTSGIIGGIEDEFGGVGVAPGADLWIAKGLDDFGSGDETMVVQSILWLVSERVQIINLSLGSPVESRAIMRAVDEALKCDIHVIAAAGNFGDQARSWPAMHPGVISVAATDENDRAADFSEPSSVDAAFPGVKILSTYRNGSFAVLDGTSMAAPGFAGVLACYLSQLARFNEPLPKPAEVFKLIETWSDDIDAPGRDEKTGFGIPSVVKYKATAPKEEAAQEPVWVPIGKGFWSFFDTDTEKRCKRIA